MPGYCQQAPVHFAARYGSDPEATRRTVETLMNEMEDPFMRDEFGNTVLHHCILNGSENGDTRLS